MKFRIYVRDHESVHVHVICQDGEAKFQIEYGIWLISNEENKELIITEWGKIYGK